MTIRLTRRQAVAAGLSLGAAGSFAAAPAKLQTFNGKVRPLSAVVAPHGSKLDADAAPHWLALVADDGTIYPLVKDAGGRLFFLDKRLLDRPMRLMGRLIPDSQLLQVAEAQSVVKGVAHQVYYWCGICSIRRYEKMSCECCGAAMELKEEPVKK